MADIVSVVIPALNAGSQIRRLLTAIKSQSVKCEIIVIDSSSSDDTINISEFCGAKVISVRKEDFNHGKTRNIGVSRTKGDVTVFLTQDALPFDERSIENLIKPLEYVDVAASYGRQIPKDNAKPTEKFARNFNYPENHFIRCRNDIPHSGIKTFFFSNVFSAVRRSDFEAIGGFPEDVIMFEDMLFAASLILKGLRVAYVPDAKVIHSHDFSCSAQLVRYFQAGVSFKKNSWFLNYARSGNEGIRFIKEEIKFLTQNKAYSWVAYALVEAVCKYSGYKIGLNYDKLPFLNMKRHNE